MIRSISITSDRTVHINAEPEDYLPILKDPDTLLWVDLSGVATEPFKPILRDIFGYHPLAIDDALAETHIPKVDDWGEYLYLVLRSVEVEPSEPLVIKNPELDIFLGSNLIVTYHASPMVAIDTIWQLCQRDQRYLTRGTANLFYHMVDEMVNHYMLVVEQIDEIIDQIEDKLFDDPKPDTLNKIFSLKRALLQLRRTLLPQREVFNKLARGDFVIIKKIDQVYFRDVYDHMVRLQEINESLRDLVSGALDTYLSVINNRMNEVMKTLTVITTLFMPLSVLTGFFGMNFFQAVLPLQAWTGLVAFSLVLAGIIFIPIGMYFWMRRRAWM